MRVQGWVLAFGIGVAGSSYAQQLTFTDYHDYKSINAYLEAAARQLPGYATTQTIGYSEERRPIVAIRFTLKFATNELDKPPVFFVNATHHGNELVSTEASLAMIQSLATEREQWQDTLNHMDIVIVPIVNPDGFVVGTRNNARGRDINRDYLLESDDNAQQPVSTEAQAMMNYSNSLRIVAALALHAGDTAVFWPWGRSPKPIPEHEHFRGLAAQLARWLRLPTFKQSAHDYSTVGEYIDFLYSKQKTIAFTIEVAKEMQPHPQTLASHVATIANGIRLFANLIGRTFKDRNSSL